MDEPSADESRPPEKSDLLFNLSPELPLPLASPDPRLTFSSLKRSGGAPECGSIKEPKKEEGSVREGAQVDLHATAHQNPANNVNLADYGVIPINEDTLRLALDPEDIQDAIEMPTAGWPTYRAPYGRDHPTPLFYEQPRIAGLGGGDPTTTQNRSAGRDIVSMALGRAGAQRVDRGEWLMMDGKGDTHSPLMVSDVAARRLPLRPIRERCNSNGPWGCR